MNSSWLLELIAVAHHLIELRQLTQQALSLEDTSSVYWLRVPAFSQAAPHQNQGTQRENAPLPETPLYSILSLSRPQPSSKSSAPIRSAPSSPEPRSPSIILSRLFVALRLRIRCLPGALACSEPMNKPCSMCPDDVPEPNTPSISATLMKRLSIWLQLLRASLVALFTSHAALRSSYATIKPALELAAFLFWLRCRWLSSPALADFQRQERVMLLGTAASGMASTRSAVHQPCVLIARLPCPY